MATVKRFDPTVGDVGGARPNVAEAQKFGTLAERLKGFADRKNKIADVEAQQQGQRAGEAAAAGTIGGVEIPEDITIRDQAFAKGARASHAAAIQLDIRKTMADLELNNSSDIEAFNLQLDSYRTGMLSEVNEGMKPMVMSELDDYALRSQVRIEENIYNISQKENLATISTAIDGASDDALSSAYLGDEDLLLKKSAQYMRFLDEGVADGLLDKATVEKQKRDFNDQVDIQNVTGVFDRTIQEEGLEAGEKSFEKFMAAKHRGLDPVVRDKMITRMRSSLSHERAKVRMERTRIKSEIKAREKALTQDVKNAEYALDRGYQVQNLPELIDVSRGTKHEKTLRTIQVHQDAVNEFVQNSPAQMDAMLSKISESKDHTGDEVRLIERLKKTRDYTRSELKAGRGMDLALEQGVIAELPPMDAPGGLQARSALAKVAEEHYEQPISPLTDSEIDDIKARLDESSADEKITQMGQLVEGLGAGSLPVLENMGGKNSGTYAVSGALMVENRGVLGREMIKGIDARAAYPGIIPKGLDDEFNKIAGSAYRRTPKQLEILRQGVKDLYAQRSANAGDTNGEANDTTRLKQVFDEVTGGVFTFEDQGSGFFSDNAYSIESPRQGVSQDQFIDWMEGLTQQEIEDMGASAAPAELTKAINDMSVELITLGSGRYQVVRNGLPVINSDHTPFILSWPD